MSLVGIWIAIWARACFVAECFVVLMPQVVCEEGRVLLAWRFRTGSLIRARSVSFCWRFLGHLSTLSLVRGVTLALRIQCIGVDLSRYRWRV